MCIRDREAGIVQSNEQPGGNVTGVSDAAPLEAQIKLIREMLPEAKTIGMLYNLGEVNGKIQVDQVKDVYKRQADEWIELEVSYTGHPKIANAARSTLMGNEISADYLFMNSLSILPQLSLNEAENFINEGEVVLPANLELISLGNEAEVVSENASTTVSYTHLDVYKRQRYRIGE